MVRELGEIKIIELFRKHLETQSHIYMGVGSPTGIHEDAGAIQLGNGRNARFRYIEESWYTEPDVKASLTQTETGWSYKSAGIEESFDILGRLESINSSAP